MHKLLYVSNTKRDFPESELLSILAVSRANNLPLGVTGLLLYIDGGFLQVLEGERPLLLSLYEKIAKDPRHWDAKVLLDQEGDRNFGKWSMGFKALRADDSDANLTDVAKGAIEGLIKPEGAQRILRILIDTFRTVQGQ